MVLQSSAGENKSINVFALRKVKKGGTKLRSTYVDWQSKGGGDIAGVCDSVTCRGIEMMTERLCYYWKMLGVVPS